METDQAGLGHYAAQYIARVKPGARPAAYGDPRMRTAFEHVAIDIGVRYLTAGSDVSYLMTAVKAEITALRKPAV
jgi:hypothetical protein